MKYYPEVEASPDIAKIEKKILEFWKKNDLFKKSIENRKGAEEFIFYDGPPFANGLPHFGHVLTGYAKDVFARYQTMKGKRVERRFGWDCHGLPAEMAAEKELSIKGKQDIESYGISKFNDYCRQSVMKYANEWEDYVTRQARWVDFKNDYKTMNTPYMESVMWAFKELYKKGLVYESYRVMPYSWAMETPLSNFETRLDNAYREREDKAITVAFELKEVPEFLANAIRQINIKKCYVLAWTTTPWTLPSNLALAVSKKIEYVCMVKKDLSGSSSTLPLEGRDKGRGYDKQTLLHAQELRKNSTEVEKKLWNRINHDQVGVKFRRQQPIGNFIVDFYSSEARLIIELDGSQHAEQFVYDKERSDFFASQGYKIIRFWNHEIMENIEGVLEAIKIAVETSSHITPSPTPPLKGEGVMGTILTGEVFICARKSFVKFEKEYEMIASFKGSDFLAVPLSYIPLFPYLEKRMRGEVGAFKIGSTPIGGSPNAFHILDGSDFVSDEEGTGIVHLAPGFGEDDQRICAANGIEVVCPVDNAGRFTDEIYDVQDLKLKGLNVIVEPGGSRFGLANDLIIKYLKNIGLLIDEQVIKHNYPHCWRTDTPLIYKAVPSWYIEVTKIKDRMVELNQQINWIPGHVRDGLFGKWLENARDWSISRNRFWGAPIPIWKSDNPDNKELYVFGSIKELEDFFGVEVKDLHKPFIDELTKPDPKNPRYTIKRVPDVFDCWFESGSMPFAQVHYPFENKEWFETHFPADFIVEYAAQTRGWFYTLMVLGTALFDKPPFLNCICHGVILDDKGQKLSKRLNNYTDPKELFERYGADSLRWFMMSSPVMRGLELLIDKDANMVRDTLRLAIKPIWNAYNFFTLYANADGVKGSEVRGQNSGNVMDRYILSKCRECVEIVTKAMDSYDTTQATRAIEDFFEVLNNWYIRRNRKRFWKSEKDQDKQDAYDTLYTVLVTMCRLSAPLLPIITEEIWQGIKN